jgi:hypothetical protein
MYSYRLRLRRIASLFISLGRICDAALLDVLGESSRAKPRQPRRTLGSATRRFGLWEAERLKARIDLYMLRRRS